MSKIERRPGWLKGWLLALLEEQSEQPAREKEETCGQLVEFPTAKQCTDLQPSGDR
jgi:hypothetical protein